MAEATPIAAPGGAPLAAPAKPSLVGLTRAQLGEALRAIGTRRSAKSACG
jgi:hypothetical protein